MLLYISFGGLRPRTPYTLARGSGLQLRCVGSRCEHALSSRSWLPGGSAQRRRSPRVRAVTPPHPPDHGQLETKNEQRGPQHRADNRRDDLCLDVDGVPGRQPSPVATLAREPVPDRERDRQELSLRERRARGWTKRPLEDHRPFPLVVARDPGEILRVAGLDIRASPAGELHRIGEGQVEEPEIDGVLSVAEDEVGFAGACRRLRTESGSPRRPRTPMAGRLAPPAPRQRGPPRAAGHRPAPPGQLPHRQSRRRQARHRRPGRPLTLLPLPPPAREATARSCPSSPGSCRAIAARTATESAS